MGSEAQEGMLLAVVRKDEKDMEDEKDRTWRRSAESRTRRRDAGRKGRGLAQERQGQDEGRMHLGCGVLPKRGMFRFGNY